MARQDYVFTSESVSEGHPDKLCDRISDEVLDYMLAIEPNARVACETFATSSLVVIGGEVGLSDKERLKDVMGRVSEIARKAIRDIGYEQEKFHWNTCHVLNFLHEQSAHIAQGVDKDGAGDQGIMFGYATTETPELLPLPIVLAHRLTRGLAEARRNFVPWLRPDGKSQVTVRYEGGVPKQVESVLISTQHSPEVTREEIAAWVEKDLAPKALDGWMRDGIRFIANPSGSFVLGGPTADAGVTGRKIIVDSYGGAARHGGGAWSGKDPSKVDRSGAYFCRWAARQVVKQGLAQRAEIQVSYAIGEARPMSVTVETFGTGDAKAAAALVGSFDFRPAAISERLNLRRPIYRSTTNYGHFGKPELPWEQ